MSAALEPDLRGDLLAIIPHLRAFAVLLTGDRERADHLVHETLTTAWGELHDLEVGTNLRVRLFKALRKLFYAECTGSFSGPNHSALRLATMTATESREAFKRIKAIFVMFSIEQREALLLIDWEGFSHEIAADICRCSIDTIQRRLNAARRCCSAPS